MLTPQLFSDLRLILSFIFNNLFSRVWLVMTSTILSFVLVAWIFAHIIKFFKRFI